MWIVFVLAAEAAVPRIVGTPVVANPSFGGVANTMMYTVTATVSGRGSDADHIAMVGFAPEDDYAGCTNTTPWKWSHTQTFDTARTREWTLYNFLPGTKYYYRVLVGSGPTTRSRCGVLATTEAPTPTLPEDLGYLNIRYLKSGDPFDTKYVLVETDDCGASGGMIGAATNYLVVLDAVNEAIVWYLDVSATSGLAGGSASAYRYYRGATAAEDAVMSTVSYRGVYEWGFDGTTRNAYDYGAAACQGSGAEGPCLHHDLVKSPLTGNTYALGGVLSTTTATGTIWEDECPDARFVDNGYHVFDSSFDETDELYLMADAGYDPTVDPGPEAERATARPDACSSDVWDKLLDSPDGLIDWLHTNSISVWDDGTDEMVDVSLKEWNQVLRFDAATGSLLWRFSARPGDSDWGTVSVAAGVTGSSRFSDQHDVHAIDTNTLMMLDNQGDSGGARVLQIQLSTGPVSAVIEKSWAILSGSGSQLRCSTEGTAELVPNSDHVLALCAGVTETVELDDPTGNSGDPPPLAISLPDGDPDPFCAVGGPDERSQIRGWLRAFPMERAGEF
jgi:hypothetical protein